MPNFTDSTYRCGVCGTDHSDPSIETWCYSQQEAAYDGRGDHIQTADDDDRQLYGGEEDEAIEPYPGLDDYAARRDYLANNGDYIQYDRAMHEESDLTHEW